MTNHDIATDLEEFHSSFRIFLEAVAVLASAPEEQCRTMGNYNVAWELKQDIQAGKYLVGRGHLTSAEECSVKAIVASVESIDTQALPSGSAPEKNLSAMSHASWVPARRLAAEALPQLAAAAALNARYLGLPESAA